MVVKWNILCSGQFETVVFNNHMTLAIRHFELLKSHSKKYYSKKGCPVLCSYNISNTVYLPQSPL